MNQTDSPRFDDRCFLTLGGTETYLHFLQGFALEDMCGFRVLENDLHYERMEEAYLFPIADAALRHGHGLVVDALVWRASSDHVVAAGYTAGDVARLNRLGVERARASIAAWRRARSAPESSVPVVIAGDLGPRGDAYRAGALGAEAARAYHRPQLEALSEAGIDLITAMTFTHAAEAVGVVRAAYDVGLDVVISPTVETDGRLPDGASLGDFIGEVDDATGGAAAFFMVNCAHPTHLLPTLDDAERSGAEWLSRLRGFRGNASQKSHAELDESPELDRGDPRGFAGQVAAMQRRFNLAVIGGCCGTDVEHLVHLAERAALASTAPASKAG